MIGSGDEVIQREDTTPVLMEFALHHIGHIKHICSLFIIHTTKEQSSMQREHIW